MREASSPSLNPSTEALLGDAREELIGRIRSRPCCRRWPPLSRKCRAARQRLMQWQILITRKGKERTLNVRVTSEQARSEERDLVITLDDITDLVTAQRTSAWADVARRIAHEIKNPLTPIQLSAERIRRKYGKVITEDREVFDQCTDTIVRQVDDIKRMVDEFSSFARMPKPTIEERGPGRDGPAGRVPDADRQPGDRVPRIPAGRAGRRSVRPAAGVAGGHEHRQERHRGDCGRAGGRAGQGRIVVVLDERIRIMSSSPSPTTARVFRPKGRQRLLEPYMTTREGGTGLGLPIVGKILEDHGGGMELARQSGGAGRGGTGSHVDPETTSAGRPGGETAARRTRDHEASV